MWLAQEVLWQQISHGELRIRVKGHRSFLLDQSRLSHTRLDLSLGDGSETCYFFIIHELRLGRVKERGAASVGIAVLQNPIVAGIADSVRASGAPLPEVEKFPRCLQAVQLRCWLHLIPCASLIAGRPADHQVLPDVPNPPALLAPVWVWVNGLPGDVHGHGAHAVVAGHPAADLRERRA